MSGFGPEETFRRPHAFGCSDDKPDKTAAVFLRLHLAQSNDPEMPKLTAALIQIFESQPKPMIPATPPTSVRLVYESFDLVYLTNFMGS
jgi:hypothetical protein